jgi:hypothetical protein
MSEGKAPLPPPETDGHQAPEAGPAPTTGQGQCHDDGPALCEKDVYDMRYGDYVLCINLILNVCAFTAYAY